MWRQAGSTDYCGQEQSTVKTGSSIKLSENISDEKKPRTNDLGVFGNRAG